MIDFLPTFNVFCNATACVLIVSGLIAIRKKRVTFHRNCMLSATFFAFLFLIGYLTRHYFAGTTPFQGVGIWRKIYFSILISHTILAIINLPLIITTLIFAFRGKFEQHRRIARITAPIWLYVSLTGVIIYLMLFQFFA